MSLPSLISLRRPHDEPTEPEDILGSSLGGIFTDDSQISYGDGPDTVVVYESDKFGDLEFHTADVNGEEQRRKFAHYLWNAGIFTAELVGGRKEEHGVDRDRDSGFFGMGEKNEEEQWGKDEWWVDREEEKLWTVKGETVLELGAGTLGWT
jgi:nicotinamide N-methyltransferase